MKFFGGFQTEVLAARRLISVEWRYDDKFRRSSTDEYWFGPGETAAFHATVDRLRAIDHTAGIPDDFDPTADAILKVQP